MKFTSKTISVCSLLLAVVALQASERIIYIKNMSGASVYGGLYAVDKKEGYVKGQNSSAQMGNDNMLENKKCRAIRFQIQSDHPVKLIFAKRIEAIRSKVGGGKDTDKDVAIFEIKQSSNYYEIKGNNKRSSKLEIKTTSKFNCEEAAYNAGNLLR